MSKEAIMRTERFMYFFFIKNYIGTQGEVCTVTVKGI